MHLCFRGCIDIIASQNSELPLNKETSSLIILNVYSGKDGYGLFIAILFLKVFMILMQCTKINRKF